MKKRIGISLLVLVLFFVSPGSIRMIKEELSMIRAKIQMKKQISQIIKKAKRVDLGKAPNNIVFVVGDLTDKKAIKIISEINQVENDADLKEIIIYLDSLGGNVTAGFAICRAMDKCRKKVKIICRRAYSSAAGILSSGTKGQRYVLTDSQYYTVMIHQARYEQLDGSVIPENQLSKTEIASLVYSDKLERDLLAKNIKLNSEQITEAVNKSTFYMAEKSAEIGFTDKVLQYK